MKPQALVIGAGFAGISAAASLAQQGYAVRVLEKQATAGGRARMFEAEGFRFDMGPSWYWMPDVFEQFYNRFGFKTADFYELKRLDPSYAVWYGREDIMQVPAALEELYGLFESLEPGSGKKLKLFLDEAAYKYEVGIRSLVYKPGLSLMEFADRRLVSGLFRLHVFRSFSKYIRKYFRHPRLLQLLEFPVLFLGAKPEDTPALYSLMNYADMALGTWYPMGGMHRIVEAMVAVATAQGVVFEMNCNVEQIVVEQGRAVGVRVNGSVLRADVVVAGADYHHVEQALLPAEWRRYDAAYWDKRVMAPSCLIYYMGVGKRIPRLQHHNLFFDTSFEAHAAEIYDRPAWPQAPLFYVSAPSVTDPTVAPAGMENLFLLVPVAPGIGDSAEDRSRCFTQVMDRLEGMTGTDIRNNLRYCRSYAHQDFIQDYNAFKGNAYGLANTLTQTAILKPSVRSKKVSNLFYTGQLTVPGPGVPPSIISGQVVADVITANFPVTRV